MGSLQDIVIAEAGALMLAVTRIAGFVLIAPFPPKNAATQTKIGLILLLAWVARAGQPYMPNLHLDISLIGLVPSELGIGLLIGFTVRITYSAAEMLGSSFAQATGLTMGSVYDPALGTDDPVPARVITLFAMLLFFAVGAHRVALGYLLESFHAIPIGRAGDISVAAPTFVDFLTQAVDAGVRLSLPVMGVALAVQLTLALVSRASPQLQIFSVGMGITVAAALLTFMGSVTDTAAGLGAQMQNDAPRIEQILEQAANGTPL